MSVPFTRTGLAFALTRRAGWLGPRELRWLARFIRFGLVGGTGLLVNTVALFMFYQLAGLPLLAASAAAVEVAIVSNFVLNDRWTFGRSNVSAGRFLRFNVISLVGLAMTSGTLWLLVTELSLYYLLANILANVLSGLWNFLGNVLWTWDDER